MASVGTDTQRWLAVSCESSIRLFQSCAQHTIAWFSWDGGAALLIFATIRRNFKDHFNYLTPPATKFPPWTKMFPGEYPTGLVVASLARLEHNDTLVRLANCCLPYHFESCPPATTSWLHSSGSTSRMDWPNGDRSLKAFTFLRNSHGWNMEVSCSAFP
ncbi:hypothetical protein CC79DRAFT_1327196 [Sarocladium strictum]